MFVARRLRHALIATAIAASALPGHAFVAFGQEQAEPARTDGAEVPPGTANHDAAKLVVPGADAEAQKPNSGAALPPATERATDAARELTNDATEKVGEVAKTIDQNETAREAAAGILQPIYLMAESLAFPAFHWVAFSLMAAGVVSYALQLVLGKLVVLFNGSLNLREILSDAISLAISAIGLVLTTQAAAENSSFTQSPAAVLSASLAGIVLGFSMYRWGQAQEVRAVHGQRVQQNKART